MKKTLTLAAATVLVLGSADLLSAQQTRTGSATITIPEVLVFDATNTSVTFAAPGTADYDAGFKAATASTVLSHRANVRHSLTIQADQASFTATNPSPETAGGAVNAARVKPAGDLLWSTDGASFTALSTTAAKVVTQTAAGGTVNTGTVSYRVALGWGQDTPGQYTLPFRYIMFAD
jgi:hypothetical protein